MPGPHASHQLNPALRLFADRLTGKSTRAMNMGSYNYLGFAQPTGACADDAERTTWKSGVGVCGSRHELGTEPSLTCLAIRGPSNLPVGRRDTSQQLTVTSQHDPTNIIIIIIIIIITHNRFMALLILSGTTRVSRYQKKHSPAHTYRGHQSSLICFFHLLRFTASSLFNPRA